MNEHLESVASEVEPASGTPQTTNVPRNEVQRQGSRVEKRELTPGATARTRAWKPRKSPHGAKLTCCSNNVCGLSEKKGAPILRAGYDIFCGQESHGDEQRKGHWPADRLFVGGAPPANDPKSGVFTLLSRDLARSVAPGGTTLGSRFPSRILNGLSELVGFGREFHLLFTYFYSTI